MTANEAKVAVAMLTVDQRETTLRALRSFGDEISRLNLLVWDNGSSDGTVEAIAAEFPNVAVHHHPENLGVASGRNAAAARAVELFSPTHILFLDNDMVVTPGFVEALLEPFAASPELGQTQAKLLYLDEPNRINECGGCRINFWLGVTDPVGFKQIDRGQCDEAAPCISCGGAMMVRADVFTELGGFDSIFDPFGPEDLDFSLRLQESGYKAMYVPTALAYHEVNHTFEGGDYTAKYARSKAKHWLRFLKRHGTPFQKAGFAMVGVPWIGGKLVIRELLRGNPGAIFGSVRGFVDAARGSKDGRG